MKNLKTEFIIALSFLIPVIVLTFAYAKVGIYPFGSKSIMIMDLHEMASIFESVKYFFTNNSSIFYTWTKAMGDNNLGLFAFYLSSPFTIIPMIFSKELLPLALLIMNVSKIGCAGISFALFLRYVFKKTDLSIVIFSVFYALMSYSIAYSMCLMWLDGVIWLPLILMGIERLLRQNKPMVLIISLMFVLISSYYIGYMVCIFVAIFFLYRFITEYHKLGFIEFYKKSYLFVISAIISACLGAWLLIPAFFS